MPIFVKMIFTIAIVAIAIVFLFLMPGWDKAGPDWAWRFNRGYLIRQAFYKPDGSPKRYTKIAIIIVWTAWLLLLWFVMPTDHAPH